MIVLTNQSGIARGYFSENDLEKIHLHIDKELEKKQAHIDKYYYSPFHPMGEVAEFSRDSILRKPAPLMGVIAGEEYQIDFTKSLMIGDKYSDKLYSLQIETLLLNSKYIQNTDRSLNDCRIFNTHQEILTYLKSKIIVK